jgi:hypothetical protein
MPQDRRSAPKARSSTGQGEIAACGLPREGRPRQRIASRREVNPPGLFAADRGGLPETGLCGRLNSAAAGHGFSPAPAAASLSLLLPSVALTRFAASSPG